MYFFDSRSGCVVRAFDASHQVRIPPEAAAYSNLHYTNVGIKDENGMHEVYSIKQGINIKFPVKTLETLITENGDMDKSITYLKLDVEGSELVCFKSWLKSGILSKVEQLAVEMHTGNTYGDKKLEKKLLKGALEFIQQIAIQHKLYLVSYDPNLCVAKKMDRLRKYYTHHDLLFVKSIQ